jgi:16S rRNA (adenine1518-N6/adenine1519-N6)-dimethyltransferase
MIDFADPRAILREIEQTAKKRFGQNFLTRSDVVRRIVRGAEVTAGDHVVEVGPGLGILTQELVGAGAVLTAVELDRDLAAWIRAAFPAVRLLEADATRVHWRELFPEGSVQVVANLPYNVGTHLVVDFLSNPGVFRRATVMLQREVAERMVAAPGDDAFGSLSIFVQTRADVQWILDVPPSAFHPPPKVDSAVIRLDIFEAPRVGGSDPRHFDRVVRAAFAQRRKTIANSLHTAFPREAIAAALAQVGIEARVRAETLSIEHFRGLAAALPPA